MTTAVIVQARMGSTRLPGKVLMRLGGDSVLGHVLRRCAAVRGADILCCATTESAEDDAVAREAERAGARVFRGATDDVLARYRDAAHALGCDVVLRVTADCPLIDPELCAAVLTLRADQAAGYACNNMPPSWPHGLDCEAFTTAALDRAASSAVAGYDREHVTPWLRTSPEISRANLRGPGGAVAVQRWTLDYAEDKVLLDAIFAHLADGAATAGWRAVAAVVEAHPGLAALNRHRRDPRRSENTHAAAYSASGR